MMTTTTKKPAPGSLNARIAEIDRDPDLTPEEANAMIETERKLWRTVHGLPRRPIGADR